MAFTLHDSIVIDLAYGERKMIPELINLFGQTEFGTFKVNTKVGLDFGNMTDLILKK